MGELESKLFEAAERDNEGEVIRLLAAGADIEARFDRPGIRLGSTPLIVAAGRGAVSAVKALLDAGADPNARTVNLKTALKAASDKKECAGGSDPNMLKTMKLLLEAGADPDGAGCDGAGLRPLDVAAMEGSAARCRILLDGGAKVDAANGASALALALHFGHGRLAGMLLAAGGDPNIKSEKRSLLYAACVAGDMPLIEKLASYGARAGSEEFGAAVGAGRVPVLDKLLEMNPKLEKEIKRKSGDLLENALSCGSVDSVRWLLDRGADQNAPTRWGPAACLAFVNMAGFDCFDAAVLDLEAIKEWASKNASSPVEREARNGQELLAWVAAEEANRIGAASKKGAQEGARVRRGI